MASLIADSQFASTLESASSTPGVTDEIQNASKEDLKKTAILVVDEQYKESGLFDATLEAKIPKFDFDEVQLGRILGRGGFCVVTEIEKVKILEEEKATPSANVSFLSRFKHSRSSVEGDGELFNESDKKSIASEHRKEFVLSKSKLSRTGVAKFSRKKSGRKGGRFALKRVSYELASSSRMNYLKGLVDMVIEAKFLSAIDHPNVVRLCGISTQGLSDFIIIERLQETLSMRFKTWTKIDRQCKGITGIFTGSKNKKAILYEDRIKASHDIACALDYLHYRRVIFRDLKPDNIGFDSQDTLKIFDFGLAKELKESLKDEQDLYKMTAFTGAVRYMAPEVGLGMPYNQYADVYSWSMIMWFILALEPPFGFYTEDMIVDRVFKRGSRPAVFDKWSTSVGDIMKQAWDTDISKRPPFAEISKILRVEMIDCEAMAASVRSSDDF